MISVTDLFCGAGGSSLGAEAAGMAVELAMNHWETAVEVHQAHFPEAAHDCADIRQADPRRYRRTDVLLASPECTNHSQARGVSRKKQQPTLWDAPDPAAERSRATMWDVPRFAEQMKYSAIVVENVVEAAKWVNWPSWCMAMEELGYERRVLSHNSMHHYVPQSRDRIYVVFTRKGIKIDLEFEQEAWCDICEKIQPCRQRWKNGRTIGRYRQQWLWGCTICGAEVEPDTLGAREIIDWTIPCPRIGDRKRPLSPKTRARIGAGLERYGWYPIITAGAGNTFERTPGNRARPLNEPLPAQTTTAQQALATPPAVLYQTAHGGRFHELANPHPTVCASDDRLSLIVSLRGSQGAQIATSAKSTAEPLRAVTAGGFHHGLLMRNNTGGAEMTTSLDEPARTLTAAGHQSLLVPYYGRSRAQRTTTPLTTVTTRDRHALVDMNQANSESLSDVIDACGFRMLDPAEIELAMAFPGGYIPGDLTKKDRIKLAGNAVTPPVMNWIANRVVQALEAA